MGRVCHGPSLYGPSLLWAEFVMGRVCYGPSCPVTIQITSITVGVLQYMFITYNNIHVHECDEGC